MSAAWVKSPSVRDLVALGPQIAVELDVQRISLALLSGLRSVAGRLSNDVLSLIADAGRIATNAPFLRRNARRRISSRASRYTSTIASSSNKPQRDTEGQPTARTDINPIVVRTFVKSAVAGTCAQERGSLDVRQLNHCPTTRTALCRRFTV